jgi:hypothetical protein
MTIIYSVESGSYSDYAVDALFSTREDAELYKKAHGGEVVERTLDPDMTEYRAGRKPYRVIMNRDGIARDVSITCDMESDAENFKTEDEWLFYVWATDKKHAVKIANERRTQHLALGTWGEPTEKHRHHHENMREWHKEFSKRWSHV